MLNNDAIKKIEKTLGYTFREKTLLKQAFTRASYHNEHPEARDNEVLEFFGDMVLSYVVCQVLMDRYTFRDDNGLVSYLQESAFTKMRSNCTNNEYLADKMRGLGLGKYLIMGKGDEKNNADEETPALSNLFESLVAAIYLDCDKDTEMVKPIVTGLLGL